MKGFTDTLAIYATRRMITLFVLGIASGLPLALTASTLTTWLADSGVEWKTIGLFAAVGMPYALKFLWAPLIDGLPLPVLTRVLGRRRAWMLLTQCGLVVMLLVMALLEPTAMLGVIALTAVGIAALSATQDIVIDAFRVESVPLEEQGAGAASLVFGYRIGMLLSGAGALALAEFHGWQMAYAVMAAVMAAMVLVTLFAGEPAAPEGEAEPEAMRHVPSVFTQGRLAAIERFIRHSVVAPFADFMTRPYWAVVLLFVILYKLGDAFMGVMFNPFLRDIGFDKLQIAEISKFYGLWATLLGAFCGGLVVARLGMYRSLLLCGLAHMLTNLLMVGQARVGANELYLIFSISAENFAGGLSTAAFVAYLAALTRRHYTATQYALLSSFAAFGRTLFSTSSGAVAQEYGWEVFFIVSCVISLPSLALLIWLERKERERLSVASAD